MRSKKHFSPFLNETVFLEGESPTLNNRDNWYKVVGTNETY